MLKTGNKVIFTVVLLCCVSTPSYAQRCGSIPQRDYGCPFSQLTPNDWCEVESYSNPAFSFYIQPGRNFNQLTVRMTRQILLSVEIFELTLSRNHLQDAEKWYRIQFWSSRAGSVGEKTLYHISIDGRQTLTSGEFYIKPGKFTVFVHGSPYYSKSCNPALFPPPSPPRLPSPQPPRATTPKKDEVITITPETVHASTYTTENAHTAPFFMENSNKSPDDPSETVLILGQPWWIFAIVGGILILIIAVIIITAVVKKKRSKGQEDEVRASNGERGIRNRTSSDPEWQYQSYPTLQNHGFEGTADLTDQSTSHNKGYDNPSHHLFGEPTDVNNGTHIYENVVELRNLDLNNEEHVYENVVELRHPQSHFNRNNGQSIPNHGRLQEPSIIYNHYNASNLTRRGSAHDSENSLYGYL